VPSSPATRRGATVAAAIAGSHGIVGDVANRTIHAIACRSAALGGLDVLSTTPRARPGAAGAARRHRVRGLELALATNPSARFAHQGAARRARRARATGDGRGAIVLNISSDAAVNAYAGWGAYGASKAALAHMSRIWHEELAPHGVAVIAVDPGDMDTPLHAAALPDADPATLKRPRDAAREIVERIDRERLAASERSST
jgi:NAD(P)-dependent dehydrogenase (short-subunit alcohol dehydrogenase family)